MIKTIEILIRCGINEIYNVIVIPKSATIYINNKKYSIDEEYINSIINIIYLWKEEYGSNNIIDSEEFQVTVTSDDGVTTFHGKGYYPYNYVLLKDIINQIYAN